MHVAVSTVADDSFPQHVGLSAIKMLQCLSQLEINAQFNYPDERANPYFNEICKHFNKYIKILQRFSDFYSENTIKKLIP